MPVTRIAEYRNKDTVQLLEQVLAQARFGDITGIVIAVNFGPSRHAMGVSGAYEADPVMAASAADRIRHQLHQKADEFEEQRRSGRAVTTY